MNGISDLKTDSLIIKPDSAIISKDTIPQIISKDTSRPILNQDAIRPLSVKDTIIKQVNTYPLNQKFKINQVPAIWVEKGRSFLEIANTYHVPLFKIYKFNKLPETDLVEHDQVIFLGEPKKDTTSTNPNIKSTKPTLKGILDLPLLKKKIK
jgi:hypothetical protein